MKGKPGQECSLGIETKVRRGPERKGDKVITDLLKRTMMLTMFCLSPASMTDLCPPSGTAEEKDQSALCGTPSSLPLSVFTSLSHSHLTSQVGCSAVLHTEATTSSCLFPCQTRVRRQDLLHHSVSTGGKTQLQLGVLDTDKD